MQNKLVTIIVPAYNAQDSIRRCIDSIKTQTYNNLELIIVDDGSQDNTVSVVNQYSKNDKRIKIFANNHNGASSARNYGIDHANGFYIYFMDADDTLLPKTIEILVKNSEKTSADIVICNMNFIYHNHIKRPLRLKNGLLNQQQFVAAIAQDAQGYTPNKIYRRACIQDLRFDTQITMCEDFLFNLEVSKNINCASIINEYLYNYYQNSDSLSRGKYTKKSATELIADEKIFSIIEKHYPDLVSLYSYILLLSTYRQKFFYKHAQFKDSAITNKISSNIKLYKNHLAQNYNTDAKSKAKIFIYEKFYFIVNLLKKIKHKLGK